MIPLRDLRKQELVKKAAKWSKTAIESYYGGNIPLVVYSAYEKYANGYIAADTNGIDYVELTTGDSFKYRKANEKYYNCFNELSAKADELGTFIVEQIVYREVNADKEYVEMTSNKEFGNHFIKLMLDNTSHDSLNEFGEEWIRTVAAILPEMKKIAEKNGTGIPTQLFNFNNAYKTTNGLLITNIDYDWNMPFDQAVAFGITALEALKNSNDRLRDSALTLAKELWV